MGNPTTIPSLSSANFAQRMAALFPNGWAKPEALSPNGGVYEFLKALGTGLSFENSGVQYADNATRIQTAQGAALDTAGVDFFGTGLLRLPGESDAAYRARMLASMFPPGATRAAVTAAVAKVTGFQPRVIEPWSPADTGYWGGFYWGVDVKGTPFRWTDFLAYQGFIECVLPAANPLAGNAVPCWDSNAYWGIWTFDFMTLQATTPLGAQAVLDAINRTKVYGTIVWVKFVSPPQLYYWDQFGLDWDQSGVMWDT